MPSIEIIIIQNVFTFVLSIVLAMLEIQIEGPDGWAANLPTWRPNKNSWIQKFWASLFSDKELTGYHLVVIVFVAMIFHMPFVFGAPLSWISWLGVMFYYFSFIILWDFLWFVLNPAYTIKKFNVQSVTWHKKWFAFMPVDYYDNILVCVIILFILSRVKGDFEPIIWGGINILLFIIQLLTIVGFMSFVLQTQKWKKLTIRKSKKKP